MRHIAVSAAPALIGQIGVGLPDGAPDPRPSLEPAAAGHARLCWRNREEARQNLRLV